MRKPKKILKENRPNWEGFTDIMTKRIYV